MSTIHDLVRGVRSELERELPVRLRNQLMEKPKEWLVEQLLSHVLAGSQQPTNTPPPEQIERERAARMERIATMQLDETKVQEFIDRYNGFDRAKLEAEGYLINPPQKGTDLISEAYRGEKGNKLLAEAKDLLYALLFGDSNSQVNLNRTQRELLTITMPKAKTHAIAFIMLAATEIGSEGTWKDPQSVSNDSRAANTLIQVEYGEVASERVGNGIKATLRLINNLEVNEQILYARMENVEESTLIT